MQNTSMISRTGFVPTQPMERASETLETINEAFRHINLCTFDMIQQIKRPSQVEFDAARMLCLFVNAFRDTCLAWPNTQFETWQTIVQFLMNSPSQNKVCLEIQNIKKKVLRPHLAKISQNTYDELLTIRTEYLDDQNRTERAILQMYNGPSKKHLKAMVKVVLTSINYLVPYEEENSENITEPIEQNPQPQKDIEDDQDSIPVNETTFDADMITNVEVPTMDI